MEDSPWFLLALFPVMALSAGFVVRSIGAAVARVRGPRTAQLLAPAPSAGPDPDVLRLQAEVDELRTQVDRLRAAEAFYAQLQAPGGPTPD